MIGNLKSPNNIIVLDTMGNYTGWLDTADIIFYQMCLLWLLGIIITGLQIKTIIYTRLYIMKY